MTTTKSDYETISLAIDAEYDLNFANGILISDLASITWNQYSNRPTLAMWAKEERDRHEAAMKTIFEFHGWNENDYDRELDRRCNDLRRTETMKFASTSS